MQALNTHQQGRDAGPLVLTCRTRHYNVLAPQATVLDAAHVTVDPVTVGDARTYLTDRAVDAARWQPLLDHLAARPGGLLATVLSTPWRLCLTATVYQRDGDPAELLTLPDADALDQHLLARFIPAVTRTSPNPRGYTPGDVHRWLHHLTTHLDPTGTLHPTAPARAEATDLVLHELWPLAGRIRIHSTDALLTSLTVLTTLPLVWTAPQSQTWPFAVLIGMCAAGAAKAALPSASPNIVRNPLTHPNRRHHLVAGLGTGCASGVMAGPGLGLGLGPAVGLGLVGLLSGVLSFGLMAEQQPRTSFAPRNVIRSDYSAGLATWLASGLTVGLSVGLAYKPMVGLAAGLTGGLAIGLTAGGAASRRYAVFLLCSRRRLPFRLALFLDWAADAGLMRYSGRLPIPTSRTPVLAPQTPHTSPLTGNLPECTGTTQLRPVFQQLMQACTCRVQPACRRGAGTVRRSGCAGLHELWSTCVAAYPA
ncbi:hypothetical protein [Streptomyces liliiviolaceus]|uniref:hypothetical protein n=1 Tax=Streptomyces liliiviolaceus TaxID=2823109 RepID=UPI001FFCC455|nr:hypothetical protein [Streptomyces liliiviolaceus]